MRGEGATARALRGLELARATLKNKRSAKAIGQDEDRAIVVDHAREHDLRDVSCKIPRGELVVVTGPSGSARAPSRSTSFPPRGNAVSSRL